MDVTGSARLDHPMEAVVPVIADLGTYPAWLRIVRSAEPLPAEPGDGQGGPAWTVELGARVGPFGRTKRVRMVRTARTEQESDQQVRFERMEHDGRSHSDWILTGEVRPLDRCPAAACELRMSLHYGGARWLPVLDAVLRDEIRRSGPRLNAYLRSP